MKRAFISLGNCLFGTFEIVFGLMILFAMVCAVLTGATEQKPAIAPDEVLVGWGTIRVKGELE